MKIGFDVAQTCDQRAGCAWYADALIRAMVPLAPDHQFFLYHQFGDWINASTEAGTHISAPNITDTFTDVSSVEAARIWGSPAELVIKTGAPDIVHANSIRAPRVPGAKLVFTMYDVSFWAVPHYTTEINRLACQAGVLQALSNADGFVFISQSAHDEFERVLPGWLEENNRPWCITPLAARAGFTQAENWGAVLAEQPFWLAVGSLEPRKNYDTLLDALELYWTCSPAPRPLWLTGGNGWNSIDLAARIESLAAHGLVRRLGYVTDEKLAQLYATATALVFPSWYEGFGLPVLEAMAFGCPVICSDRTSLPEVGGTAVTYINPAKSEEIVQAMLQMESPKGRESQKIDAIRQQVAKFSWRKTAEATLRFYEQVLRKSS